MATLATLATAIQSTLAAKTSFSACNVAFMDVGIVDRNYGRIAAVIHGPDLESVDGSLGNGYRRQWTFPIDVWIKARPDTVVADTKAVYDDVVDAFEHDYTLGGAVLDCHVSHIGQEVFVKERAGEAIIHGFVLTVDDRD